MPSVGANPPLLHELTRAEHLLVWAMRAIALGNADCPIVVNTFRDACGRRGDEALQAYGVFIKYIAMIARQRLRVHVPGCACVGEDEIAVLNVISTAQTSLETRSDAPLRTHLIRVTGRNPDDALIFVAQSIANLLATSGINLSSAEIDDADEIAPSRPGAAVQLLH